MIHHVLVTAAIRYPTRQTHAVTAAYCICVDTWFRWLLCAPALDITVVSEIGEIWSPQTAPARTADTEIIIISRFVPAANMPVAIGTRIANVPQEVPVEKERNTATANSTTGIKILADAWSPTTLPTNWARPIASPTPFKVHAKTRIVTAGTISLKPSDRLSIKLLKVMTFRGRYSAIINRIVTTEAKIR